MCVCVSTGLFEVWIFIRYSLMHGSLIAKPPFHQPDLFVTICSMARLVFFFILNSFICNFCCCYSFLCKTVRLFLCLRGTLFIGHSWKIKWMTISTTGITNDNQIPNEWKCKWLWYIQIRNSIAICVECIVLVQLIVCGTYMNVCCVFCNFAEWLLLSVFLEARFCGFAIMVMCYTQMT